MQPVLLLRFQRSTPCAFQIVSHDALLRADKPLVLHLVRQRDAKRIPPYLPASAHYRIGRAATKRQLSE
jgi:hypothetical protein